MLNSNIKYLYYIFQATIKKATILDLSNNLLTFLPVSFHKFIIFNKWNIYIFFIINNYFQNTFVDLKQIIKLDLSKNMLTEIPENFGELRQLKHLDLYANQVN